MRQSTGLWSMYMCCLHYGNNWSEGLQQTQYTLYIVTLTCLYTLTHYVNSSSSQILCCYVVSDFPQYIRKPRCFIFYDKICGTFSQFVDYLSFNFWCNQRQCLSLAMYKFLFLAPNPSYQNAKEFMGLFFDKVILTKGNIASLTVVNMASFLSNGERQG